MLGLGSLFDDEGIDVSSLGFSTDTGKPGVQVPSLPRPQCGLSGISNQGATCYLNSLLQTLLFTPEFRENLFMLDEKELGRLADKESTKVRVIPLELQRLFVRLLLSDRQSVLTTDLTNSFGWTNNEELQQHDVQELNRILFSAIEESLVGTSGRDLINRLYHGKIVNQIICTVCGKVSEREEDFLDLCVTVAGSESLENGLDLSYCQMEMMDGKNQYRCDQCSKLVDARKGARIRSLPEILTVSLLRFSFDLVKLQRYKETGKYVFPKRLNMAKYCEQVQSEEIWYDLFSVVIHRGGAHGGHYYAYIRDVDGIGKWTHPEEEAIQLPADPSTGEVDFIEFDSPVELIQAILSQKPDHTCSIDKLAAEISKQTGVSWNKRFKKQYGPIIKFLQKYNDKFVVELSSNLVCLRQYGKPRDGSGDPSGQSTNVASVTTPSQSNHSPSPDTGQCWYSFDDVRIHPIREEEIQKTFSGKSSAYMLFYRKADLYRPVEAQCNPSYQIPDDLITEVLAENEELKLMRKEYDLTINRISLQIHFHQWFQFNNGALHPKDYQSSFLELAIDRRKTVEDLKIAIMELGGELVDEPFVLHRMKEVPAGFHLYDEISVDNNKVLSDLNVQDNTMIFVWDGVQVEGIQVTTGILQEPLLLNISSEIQQNILIRGFPRNMLLSSLKQAVCDILDLDCDSMSLQRVLDSDKDGSRVLTFTLMEYDDTLETLKLKDGDQLLIQDTSIMTSTRPNVVAKQLPAKVSLTVENRCKSGDGINERCRVEIETSQKVSRLKSLALTYHGIMDVEESYRLRVDDEQLGLKPPLYEEKTVEECGLNKFSVVVLEKGQPPSTNQINIAVSVPDLDLDDLDIMLDRTTTVSFCLQCAINKAGLTDEKWHLQKTNWCGEAAEVLDDLDASLEQVIVHHGDRLLLQRGHIPPKGFINPAIWLYPPPNKPHCGGDNGSMVSWITNSLSNLLLTSTKSTLNDVKQCALIGEVEISLQSTLDDLRIQIMTLDKLSQLNIPTLHFMRVRVINEDKLGAALRGSDFSLQKLKLKSCTRLAIQILPQEEQLSQNQILLEVMKRIPETKSYESAVELIWDVSQGATVQSLKQAVADMCFIPQEYLCIAKHFENRFEWSIIKDNTKKQAQNQKGKKKKLKSNIRQAPYCIQDGDRIGVKNLQFDPLKEDDFSTLEDEKGRAELLRLAEEKRKQREEKKKQGSGNMEFGKQRRPEVALTIKVDNFRM